MKTNNLFSFKRIILLCKQSMIVNKKLIIISLFGFSGAVFITLMLSQAKVNFISWENYNYMRTLTFLFFSLGVIYSGLSFPAFRSKEKSVTYLLLPASVSEKFTFEILTRIVVFILIFPIVFWLVANFEGFVVHHYVPRLTIYKFSLGQAFSEINDKLNSMKCIRFLAIQVILFVFIIPFTGASHFTKSPLLKTLISFSIIVGSYALLVHLLAKGSNINENHLKNDTLLFINYKGDPLILFAIAITVVNLCMLTLAYFRLKKKDL